MHVCEESKQVKSKQVCVLHLRVVRRGPFPLFLLPHDVVGRSGAAKIVPREEERRREQASEEMPKDEAPIREMQYFSRAVDGASYRSVIEIVA